MKVRLAILLLVLHFLSWNVMAKSGETVKLPQPSLAGEFSLEQLLEQRRSIRDFPDSRLSLAEAGQLLWSAQGITHGEGFRTAPSAGALYPLELIMVVGQVKDLPRGIYRYEPKHHQPRKTADDDVRSALSAAALSQSWLADAAVVFAFTADYQRTTVKYGKRGIRYVHMEVGHAAQNLFLQAEALGLGTVPVGAFNDNEVAEVLQLPGNLEPLLLMPVGSL